MFVPLTHPPGHAQVDFGEALAVIGGVERKIHFLAMSLPHSDACFVKAYPGETTEAFCDGHVSGFSFFGGVPRSILYDNTRIAVARILGDGKRQRTRVFSELRSHYLFEDRFGRPGKGNDKGKVEGIVGYCRRNFLVPMPRFRNFDDLNTHLEACCAMRWAEQLRGHGQTVGERLERDRAVLQRLPAIAYDACDKRPGRVSSLSLVRYRGTDYSVPTRFGHCEVLVRGYVHEVVISCAAEVIARHPRTKQLPPARCARRLELPRRANHSAWRRRIRMKIKDILQRDPAANPLINQGQARITDRQNERAMEELHGELSTFVCEGQYADGVQKIIRSFIDNPAGTGVRFGHG